MGRSRVHDDTTAAALLDAAERIVETDGLAALTVRGVAEVVGTTTRAVYSTLGSKQALLAALGTRAFDILGALVDELPVTADPAADVIAAGLHGFRRFALAHPVLFHVGVQQTSVPEPVQVTIRPAAARALVALVRRVERLQTAGGLGGRSVSDATWQFHCACEGLAAVEIRGILSAEDAERVWADCLGSLVTGWRHQPPPRAARKRSANAGRRRR